MHITIDLSQAIHALSETLDLVGVDQVYHGKRVGYMADEAPGDSGDGMTIDIGKVTGLHAAAIKAMAKKIDKLEKRAKEK